MNAYVTFALRAVLLGTSLIAAVQSDPKPTPPPQPHPSRIEGLYAGPWVTTNRKLDGVINCRVKQIEPEHWQGHFWGVWQHVPLDYTVEFCGDPIVAQDRLHKLRTHNRMVGRFRDGWIKRAQEASKKSAGPSQFYNGELSTASAGTGNTNVQRYERVSSQQPKTLTRNLSRV
jgi:hypothetical protein